MKIPFVTFLPMEKELNDELRGSFERVFTRSWYIGGVEDEAFEKMFAEYCGVKYCVGVGNGRFFRGGVKGRLCFRPVLRHRLSFTSGYKTRGTCGL